MKNRYRFAAALRPEEGGAYSVYFPQLDGAFTEGRTFEEAVDNANEVMRLHLYSMEQEGIEIPEEDLDVPVEAGEKIVVIQAIMPTYREEMRNKAVKKTLTLPAWLNEAGEEAGINFSLLLQNAVKDALAVQRSGAS